MHVPNRVFEIFFVDFDSNQSINHSYGQAYLKEMNCRSHSRSILLPSGSSTFGKVYQFMIEYLYNLLLVMS